MMPRIAVHDLAVHYGSRLVFEAVSFQLSGGQSVGVIGGNGAGKTTLLRAMVGGLTPSTGAVSLDGRPPRQALRHTNVAYFAGDATLPGFVRACTWGTLGTGQAVTADRRPIRALSRGTRQLLGLRTALGRHPLDLVILDEPWEGLDADAARWLTATLEAKRDRGAAIILSSHRLHDLAGLCDSYVCLVGGRATVIRAHEIAPPGAVTGDVLTDLLDRMRGGPLRLFAAR